MATRVSICIIYRQSNPTLSECLDHCSKLNFKEFEVILLPDDKESTPFTTSLKQYSFPIRIIPTGKLNIPQKRNIGISAGRSQWIAFIDDDAYPDVNWLSSALPNFDDPAVGIVGGPNLTPSEDPFLERIAGNFLRSRLGFGGGYIRHTPVSLRAVDELPACNLIVRRTLLDSVTFDETLLAGEDTRLCFDLINRGFKVLYSPTVIVYHHRRRVFLAFARQLFNYGFFRGKQLTNRQVRHGWYLVPTFFFAAVVGGALFSIFSLPIRRIFPLALGSYLFITLVESLRVSSLWEAPFTWPTFFIGHMSYGFGLLRGLFSRAS